LELMGVEPTPPNPASTILQIGLNEKADSVFVPPRTRVETRATTEDAPVVFETERGLLASNNRIVSAFSQYHDQFADHSKALETGTAHFDPFLGTRTVERYLYLCDERFQFLEVPSSATVEFDFPGASEKDVMSYLSWSYWDGQRWNDFYPAAVETPANLLVFEGPIPICPTSIEEKEGYWIRAQLVDVPQDSALPALDQVRARVEVLGEGVLPDSILTNPYAGFFSSLDPERNLAVFGKEPTVDTALYLRSDDLFSLQDITVKFEVELVETAVAPRPTPSESLALAWEFHDGKRWRVLGKSGSGVTKKIQTYDFEDGTHAFTQDGVIRFRRPKNMKSVSVNGLEGFWVRCRIEEGDYGVAGSYELDGDRWLWRDERPLRPPVLRGLTQKFQEEDRQVQRIFSYNDFRNVDYTESAANAAQNFQPFEVTPEECPTLYVGFEEAFPHDTISVYFHAAEEERGGILGHAMEGNADPDVYLAREQSLIWEFWSGKRWLDLPVEDETCNLTQSGFVEFIAPKNHRVGKRFGQQAYWIRVRLEMGGYHTPPKLQQIMLNAVRASNVVTYTETVLGSSEGTPNQSFSFPRGPVLDDEVLEIIEENRPLDADMEFLTGRFGKEAVREHEDGGWRVRWERVDSFFESGPGSRHYLKDVVTHEVRFGDGQKGKIPDKGNKNVRAAQYRVGGGAVGNVAARSLVVLRKPIAYVENVRNPFPAKGGSDLESVESIMQRGPFMLKSRNRAVTAEDYEWLARQASPSVARVKCVPTSKREGEVSVIIVPRLSGDDLGYTLKPIPTLTLLRQVKRHLNKHKLITTVLHVVKPNFVEFDVDIEVYRRTGGGSDRVKRAIEVALRRFCHPLMGGRDGRGWPFGRSVYKVDLFHVSEEVPGVDLVHRIRLHDVRDNREVDFMRVADDELIFIRNVDVTERSREQIV